MSGPLVIVGCGASKRDVRAAAGDLYLGGYHKACRTVADAVAGPSRTLILSALHGLLALSDEVDPYDLRMGERGSVTEAEVREQARQRGLLDETPVIVLAGSRYVKVAQQVWPSSLHTPLAGVGGMGKQLAELKRLAADPSAALPYVPPTPGPHLVRPGVQVESIPSVGPKTGGRYGGVLVSVTERTAVVDCHDGLRRRFPVESLGLSAAPILVEAWRNLGYVDPETGKATTHYWGWVDWTLAQHLSYEEPSQVVPQGLLMSGQVIGSGEWGSLRGGR